MITRSPSMIVYRVVDSIKLDIGENIVQYLFRLHSYYKNDTKLWTLCLSGSMTSAFQQGKY
jgi:hypothetical protein